MFQVVSGSIYRPAEVHIGNNQGRIAIWCNESDANDILYRFPELASEIGRAIEVAYPEESNNV